MFGLFGGSSDIDDYMQQIIGTINAHATQAINDLDKYITQGIKEGEKGVLNSRAISQPFSQMAIRTMDELASFLGMEGSQGQKALTGEQIQQKVAGLPGYQFQFDQGLSAIEHSQASKGLLNSGRTAKALTSYGQGFASQMYGEHLNRLSGVLGATSLFPMQQMGQETAFGMAQLGARTQQGTSAADVQMQAGSAIANALAMGGQRQWGRNESMLSGIGSLAGQVIGGFL